MSTPLVGCPELNHPDSHLYANRWFLVDQDLQWLTDPALESVELSIKHAMMVIRAPGMLRIDIPLDVIEDDDSVRLMVTVGQQQVDVVDEGDLSAVWFSNLTGRSCRLVKVHPDAQIPAFQAPGVI